MYIIDFDSRKKRKLWSYRYVTTVVANSIGGADGEPKRAGKKFITREEEPDQ